MIKPKESNLEVRIELIRLASSNLFKSSLAVLINAIIITIVFWNITDKKILLLWLFALTFTIILRNIQANKNIKNIKTMSIVFIEKSFKRNAILTAILISAGISIFFPADKPYHQAFLIMIMAGLGAGTVMSLSVYKDLVRNYLIILIVPLTYIIYQIGDDIHSIMALLITIFMLLFISFSKNYHEKIIELITSNIMILQSEKELKLSENNFSSIFKEVPIGVLTYDKNLIVTQANISISNLLKAPMDKLIKLDIKVIRDQSIRPAIDATLCGERGYYEGIYHTQISNENIWIKMQTVPMYDIYNNIRGGLAIIEDITERIKADEKIRYQAFYDHLTGLANRLTLNDRLEQQIPRLARHNRYGSILFIDLDHFKTINDSLGHHIGDILLKTFANRASSMMRAEDTLARLGGDEFVILLSDLSDTKSSAIEHSHIVAKKLHRLMKEPIEVEGHILYITLSVGATLISKEESDINVILKHADIAMYKAKQLGRNTTCFFEQEMSEKIESQLILGSELREALNKNQLELYYQPIVEIKSSNITSCEALIRWNHPTKGLIYPDDFIPYAEESGLILSIGNWVIERACIDYKKIKGKVKNISINISSKQFNQNNFVDKILQTTKEYSVNPSALKLELTESVALDNLLATTDKMNLLKSHGFIIAMDDFGTGYSSLSYLKNLPFDFLKIDRSFIQNVLNNEDDASLVRTILSISKQFNFKVIAEGVEEKEHIDFLDNLDCEYYQGYVMSKAIPIDKFEKFLKDKALS
ncbi:bifunctional diguanylate cyclase/phosphodiesterase [Sulfurimonas sp.]|uniref:sensor domain-containing protein n=1 Tax=Sulfurimonas sp. TaxID=2022749 RepID=UPI0025DD8F70|nr:bifunctional diguanylate cyclase/phosphodiesterase [Sulfurimonas sp.]